MPGTGAQQSTGAIIRLSPQAVAQSLWGAGWAGTAAGEVSDDSAGHPLLAGLHLPQERPLLLGRFWVRASKAGFPLECIFPKF